MNRPVRRHPTRHGRRAAVFPQLDDPRKSYLPGICGAGREAEERARAVDAGWRLCVLRRSLAWPLQHMVRCVDLDNRPAHRVLCAKTALPAARRPRRAAPRWRAMAYHLYPSDDPGTWVHAPSRSRKAVW